MSATNDSLQARAERTPCPLDWPCERGDLVDELCAALGDATDRVETLEREKNGAYAERDRLVAALSKLFPASLERHVGEEWEDDWRWVVFIDLPHGQASWHIHDSELPWFTHLPREVGRAWDGHTTEQKYAALAEMEPRYFAFPDSREMGETP